MIPKFINKLGKCALLDNPLNAFFMFRYFRNHFVNKYKHTYSQKMPLTALILTIIITAHKNSVKCKSSISKGFRSLPKQWRLNATTASGHTTLIRHNSIKYKTRGISENTIYALITYCDYKIVFNLV